ncbi:MAG: AraC family transcriptional regulator [Chloroflexota bacterium]
MDERPSIPEETAHTFAIHQSFENLDSGWRSFPGHYFLYASSGAFVLDVGDMRWILPPHRAAWIAAETPIRVRVEGVVTCTSVLFAKGTIDPPQFDCRVFPISTLAREMVQHASRWGPERNRADKVANTFFLSLASVCEELAAHPDQFWLPQGKSSEMKEGLEWVLSQLEEAPSFADLAQNVHLSERTLARRFKEEIGLTWRQFVRRARMIRSMEMLAEDRYKIIEIAQTVGFSSVSAFNRAFRDFSGETPSAYRQRLANSSG